MNRWIIGAISVTILICLILLFSNRTVDNPSATPEPVVEKTTIPDNDMIKELKKPELTIDISKKHTVTLQTSEGDIVIELDVDETPITSNNFVYLAANDFYDNTIFHRVISGFMIQGGDPTGTGMGSPGYRFEDEPITKDYQRGTVAMANSGPNTNGSQFFIMHADYSLPKNYVIFGQVVEGLEVVDKIAEAEVKTSLSGEKSSPVNPVHIIDATVTSE